ncbi:uncharacterized protein SPPG_09149 [Spizellomyces punctatus DAOM BR117]|uniref:Protein N-terminal glutamine amidohydrolase n=1 Tax=Spizellomyces punctatus (strain DAOM BR117) TaxID=645134 RepID=A0A0L0HIL7_SPIPD|nr:uncharacterized protein SPPG_09149 [Spizellomyces punctatus DAOM BR117]KND00715.1 hypothetical protein SPPG_09149 [Spizellomyces punctatus DAOM BR117]|eukprot:XP_016608754.1 hypothetical protein SPPG_09149 [Spizellomyces punctatus DAOM BR117]
MSSSEAALSLFPYTRCYCEENVYNFCRLIEEGASSDLPQIATVVSNANVAETFVVFVSSEIGWVEMHKQKSGKVAEDGRIIWDYHVFAIVKPKNAPSTMVYDFDTMLDFPTPFSNYINESFRSSRFPRKFRIVPAKDYLLHFASDRRHMRMPGSDASSESPELYSAPPPLYPPIKSSIPLSSSAFLPVNASSELSRYWGSAHNCPITDEHRLPLYLRMGEEMGGGESSDVVTYATTGFGKVVDLPGLCKAFG